MVIRKFKLNKASGFTLIELLVVISIIGILSGLLLTNLFSVRERARDARRKQDLNEIRNALRLYYNDHQEYPTAQNFNIQVGATEVQWGQVFQEGSTIYMKSLPKDPSWSTANPSARYWYHQGADTDNFVIVARLENASDEEALPSQSRCGTLYSSSSIPKLNPDRNYVLCAD